MNDVTRDLLEETQGYVEQAKAKAAKAKKPWQTWIDAEWGFRNHWYPASLGRHVNEGDAIGIELLGEDILITRQNGKIHVQAPHDSNLQDIQRRYADVLPLKDVLAYLEKF